MAQLFRTADQSTLPDTMAKADKLMLAGAALTLVEGVVAALAYLHRPGVAGSNIVSGVVVAAIWWWVAKACAQGRSGARVLATVFFCFSTLGVVSTLSSRYHFASAVIVALNVLIWFVGLGVVVLLWQRPSSAFFESRGRFPR